MIDALNPFRSDDFELVDTHAHPDTLNIGTDQPEMKPELGIYEMHCGRRDVTDFAVLDHHMEFKFYPGDDSAISTPHSPAKMENSNTPHMRAATPEAR